MLDTCIICVAVPVTRNNNCTPVTPSAGACGSPLAWEADGRGFDSRTWRSEYKQVYGFFSSKIISNHPPTPFLSSFLQIFHLKRPMMNKPKAFSGQRQSSSRGARAGYLVTVVFASGRSETRSLNAPAGRPLGRGAGEPETAAGCYGMPGKRSTPRSLGGRRRGLAPVPMELTPVTRGFSTICKPRVPPGELNSD